MKKLLFRILTFFAAGTLLLAACDFPGANPSGSAGPQITQTMQAVATDVQSTMAAAALTAVAPPTATAAGATAVAAAPTGTIAPTATLLPTSTPMPSETPAATTPPIVAPTAAPAYPTAQLSQVTNCRTGPSTDFAVVFSAQSGANLQIVSRTDVSSYVVVANPNKSGQTCWLWTQYATINGDLSSLPLATTPALPTSARSFTVSYYRMETCSGSEPSFKVVNTGSTTWQSYTLVVRDITSKTTETISNSVFDKRSGCTVTKSISPLDPGLNGFLYSDQFSYDLTEHSIRATITLFSHDDLTGASLTQVVNFTP